jgi:hypothetical protein
MRVFRCFCFLKWRLYSRADLKSVENPEKSERQTIRKQTNSGVQLASKTQSAKINCSGIVSDLYWHSPRSKPPRSLTPLANAAVSVKTGRHTSLGPEVRGGAFSPNENYATPPTCHEIEYKTCILWSDNSIQLINGEWANNRNSQIYLLKLNTFKVVNLCYWLCRQCRDIVGTGLLGPSVFIRDQSWPYHIIYMADSTCEILLLTTMCLIFLLFCLKIDFCILLHF